ncbi:MAG: thioredoxin fold domain-containing protein [Paludibacteraceae bacterium]|nr:thioredoxin fold domain-containing protein [Paludibacteraceae bacterium]
MKKLMVIAVLSLFFGTICAQDEVRYMTTADFKARVFDYTRDSVWQYKGEKPCVIDLYADWCGPCRRLAPIMAELAEDHCDEVVFYKVNVDKERELAYYFQASSIPMLIFIPLKGKPQVLRGLRPKEDLEAVIQEILLK